MNEEGNKWYIVFSVELVEQWLQLQFAGDFIVGRFNIVVVEEIGGIAAFAHIQNQIFAIVGNLARSK